MTETPREIDLLLWNSIGTKQHALVVELYEQLMSLRSPKKATRRSRRRNASQPRIRLTPAPTQLQQPTLSLQEFRSLRLPSYG
jgi:hypothetical protein